MHVATWSVDREKKVTLNTPFIRSTFWLSWISFNLCDRLQYFMVNTQCTWVSVLNEIEANTNCGYFSFSSVLTGDIGLYRIILRQYCISESIIKKHKMPTSTAISKFSVKPYTLCFVILRTIRRKKSIRLSEFKTKPVLTLICASLRHFWSHSNIYQHLNYS